MRGVRVTRHWRDWLARFLPAEALGLVGSYLGYALCIRAGLPPLAAAYGAAFGENIGYYGAVCVRDWFALPADKRSAGRVLRAMGHDFGLAEALDTLLIRPAATLAGVHLMGQAIGIAAGKIVSDLVFYALAITLWERRRAREDEG